MKELPKLKQRDVPFSKMTKLLKSYGLNGTRLGLVLGYSPHTAKLRLDNPSMLTMGDLDHINRYADIPWDEIKEAMVR